MKILITGVAGFIGFHLANKLLNEKNLLDLGHDGEIGDRSYSVLRIKDGKFEKVAYSVAFRDEVRSVVGRLENFIKNLESLEDEVFGLKQEWIEYLKKINKFSPIPLLRKDFIVDEFQIAEGYAAGADFILLIAKALEVGELKRLFNFAKNIGLEVLFEIHDEEDLNKALEIGADIIGFNHRNLKTFEMDMDLSKRLIPKLPKDVIVVAESGINDFETVKKLSKNGVDAYLVGEYFMRQKDIKKAVLNLKGKTE